MIESPDPDMSPLPAATRHIRPVTPISEPTEVYEFVVLFQVRAHNRNQAWARLAAGLSRAFIVGGKIRYAEVTAKRRTEQ